GPEPLGQFASCAMMSAAVHALSADAARARPIHAARAPTKLRRRTRNILYFFCPISLFVQRRVAFAACLPGTLKMLPRSSVICSTQGKLPCGPTPALRRRLVFEIYC